MLPKTKIVNNSSEASFTLIETVVAMGIMVTVIAQMAGVNSNAAYFSDYGRKSIQAVWLAKRVMSQVENYRDKYDFKAMKAEEENLKFDGVEDYDEFREFTYNIALVEWKLPLVKLLTGGVGGGASEGDSEGNGGSGDMITNAITKTLGDDLLRVAHVEVFWPEGSRRNSESLTLLLTNQKKIDEIVGQMGASVKKKTPDKKAVKKIDKSPD
jgi:hypothetical protein